ncbi:uncharacterized protein LOC131655539 [Vicia villosa]|uniref:uncharacterized protein LOC131655539 n=1 Tax=Vicia villosa TaxID=3911 RepID=UPI00273CCBC9|nr:uncharacterized protein LOC131655539 [Vicia villosa]
MEYEEYKSVPTEESNTRDGEKNTKIVKVEYVKYEQGFVKVETVESVKSESSGTHDEHTHTYRDIYDDADQDKFVDVVLASIEICLILIIFPILDTSSDAREFMTENYTLIGCFLFALLIRDQGLIFLYTIDPSVGSNIFDILFVILLSTIISVIEVSAFSWCAAIITLIHWAILIALVVKFKWNVISKEDIVFSKAIHKFVGIICVLSIAHSIKSLLYFLHY